MLGVRLSENRNVTAGEEIADITKHQTPYPKPQTSYPSAIPHTRNP